MAVELNKVNLAQMGVKAVQAGQMLKEKTPQGTLANQLGEFLSQLPKAVSDVKAITENIKQVKGLEGNAIKPIVPQASLLPNQQPQQMPQAPANVVMPEDRVDIRVKIDGMITDLFNKVGENEEVLKNMSAFDMITMLKAQKNAIVDKFIEELSYGI